MMDRSHKCPRRGCQRRVDNAMFACYADWFMLPAPVRDRIRDTAHMHVLQPERRAAIELARRAWGVAGEALRT